MKCKSVMNKGEIHTFTSSTRIILLLGILFLHNPCYTYDWAQFLMYMFKGSLPKSMKLFYFIGASPVSTKQTL